MPDFLISITKRAAVGEVIRVRGDTPDQACNSAIEYGLSKPVEMPVEFLPWTCGIESLQDENNEVIEIPGKYADRVVRIEVMEQLIRDLLEALTENGYVNDVLIDRAKTLLSDH